MGFLSAAQIAELWGISERSVRNYCANGRVPGAFLVPIPKILSEW